MLFRDLMEIMRVSVTATRRFFKGNYTYYASALAYTTLLAIVPLLLVIVFFLTIFPASKTIIALGENYIVSNFVPTSAVAIEKYFQGFIQQAIHLPLTSILFLFVTTILLVHTIEETLNEIWGVPPRKHAKKVIAVFFHLIVFLLIPLIIGWTVFLSSYAFLLTWIAGPAQAGVSQFVLALLPTLINTMVFSLLYIIVPNIKIKWLYGLAAGFMAAVLFEVARVVFAFYLEQFPNYAIIYGAFAIIPIFLLWLYIFWFIILFCPLFISTWLHGKEHK